MLTLALGGPLIRCGGVWSKILHFSCPSNPSSWSKTHTHTERLLLYYNVSVIIVSCYTVTLSSVPFTTHLLMPFTWYNNWLNMWHTGACEATPCRNLLNATIMLNQIWSSTYMCVCVWLIKHVCGVMNGTEKEWVSKWVWGVSRTQKHILL